MLIELDGEVGQITYSNGWKAEVELRQPLPHDGTSGYPNSQPYRSLVYITLHISEEDAHALTTGDPPLPSLKLFVEIAK